MKEYLQSEQEDDTYCLFDKERFAYYDGADCYNTTKGKPIDGKVIGTFMVTESGYDPIQGTTYDECNVFLYEDEKEYTGN